MQRALIVILAGIIITACGVDADEVQCNDYCDKQRDCNPTISDIDWELCVDACEEEDYSREFVDCVMLQSCQPDFALVEKRCKIDPANYLQVNEEYQLPQ